MKKKIVIRFFILKSLKAEEIYEHLLYKKFSSSKRTIELGLVKLYVVMILIVSTIQAKDNEKPQSRQKSLSKLVILLVKIQVSVSLKLLLP